MTDLADFTHTDFDPYRGTGFSLSADESPALGLTLSEVKPRSEASSSSSGSPRRQSFSLLFVAGANDPDLPQGVYHLEHGEMGAFDLFLVPIGPKDGAMQYEAVFT